MGENANDGTLYRVTTSMRKEKEKLLLHSENLEQNEKKYKILLANKESELRKKTTSLSERDQQLKKIVGMVGNAEQAESIMKQNKQFQSEIEQRNQQIKTLKNMQREANKKIEDNIKEMTDAKTQMGTMQT